MAAERSNQTVGQRNVRRYGASLGLVALALLISRYVTPSGASSPLVLLGATAAVAYFGGRWPALFATLTAAIVNGVGIGVGDVPRLAVESSMIALLGSLLAFRIPVAAKDPVEKAAPVFAEAVVSRVNDDESTIESKDGPPQKSIPASVEEPEALLAASLLIVHGNAVLRLALRSTLAGLGYSVRDVANVGQAAPLLETGKFDALVLEIGRADDAAFAAVERLRGASDSGGSKECVMIVLANADNDDDRELLQAAGADHVLRKPIDTAGVAAKVQEQVPIPLGRLQSRVGLGASP